MTTDELHAAFPPGIVRDPWAPGRYRAWSALRDQACAAEGRATDLWTCYWWADRWNDPAAEAVLFQATDVLLRLSGLLMLEAARVQGEELP